MDEYDALVTNERIKNIFLLYLYLKMNLTHYIDVTNHRQGPVAYTCTIFDIPVMVFPIYAKIKTSYFPSVK